METKTAFDLNTAIQRWREHLRQSPHFRPENLDELETHLRDSVAAFGSTALSEEEAFLVAARRLGGAPALEPEFAKVNGSEVWMNRLLWMLTGILLWGGVVSFSRAAGQAGVIAGLLGLGYTPSVSKAVLPGILFCVAQLACLALCGLGCVWLYARVGGSMSKATAYLVQRPGRLALAVVAVSFVLLAGYAPNWIEHAYLAHRLEAGSYGALAYSQNLGSLFAMLLETFALVTVAFLLARHRIRRNIKA
jgi:hypothetical protein